VSLATRGFGDGIAKIVTRGYFPVVVVSVYSRSGTSRRVQHQKARKVTKDLSEYFEALLRKREIQPRIVIRTIETEQPIFTEQEALEQIVEAETLSPEVLTLLREDEEIMAAIVLFVDKFNAT